MRFPEPPIAPTDAVETLKVMEPGAPAWWTVKVRLLMVRVAVRELTELMAGADQVTVFAEVETVSHAGAPVTDHVLKSAGEGVTVKVPVPPVCGAAAEVALSVTEPAAPVCVSV